MSKKYTDVSKMYKYSWKYTLKYEKIVYIRINCALTTAKWVVVSMIIINIPSPNLKQIQNQVRNLGY